MALITDPIDALIGPDGDIVIDGDLQVVSGIDAVAKGIGRRLRKVRGEFFADITRGVPWLARETVPETDAILGQRFNEVRARTAIREAILASPGVQSILELLVTFSNASRTASIRWTANTIYGVASGTEEI